MPPSYLQGYNYTDLSFSQKQAENFRFPIQRITSKDQYVHTHVPVHTCVPVHTHIIQNHTGAYFCLDELRKHSLQ